MGLVISSTFGVNLILQILTWSGSLKAPTDLLVQYMCYICGVIDWIDTILFPNF